MGRVSWRRFPLVFARACRPCPVVANRVEHRKRHRPACHCLYGAQQQLAERRPGWFAAQRFEILTTSKMVLIDFD